ADPGHEGDEREPVEEPRVSHVARRSDEPPAEAPEEAGPGRGRGRLRGRTRGQDLGRAHAWGPGSVRARGGGSTGRGRSPQKCVIPFALPPRSGGRVGEGGSAEGED